MPLHKQQTVGVVPTVHMVFSLLYTRVSVMTQGDIWFHSWCSWQCVVVRMFVLFKLCLVPFLHVHPSRPYSKNFCVPEYSDIFMMRGKPHFKGVSVRRIKYTIILNYFGLYFYWSLVSHRKANISDHIYQIIFSDKLTPIDQTHWRFVT